MSDPSHPTPWFRFFAHVVFDAEQGNQLGCIYPPSHSLPRSSLKDLKFLSIPDSSTMRNSSSSSTSLHTFTLNRLFCTCLFVRQKDGSARGCSINSVVLASPFPFFQLHRRVLRSVVLPIVVTSSPFRCEPLFCELWDSSISWTPVASNSLYHHSIRLSGLTPRTVSYRTPFGVNSSAYSSPTLSPGSVINPFATTAATPFLLEAVRPDDVFSETLSPTTPLDPSVPPLEPESEEGGEIEDDEDDEVVVQDVLLSDVLPPTRVASTPPVVPFDPTIAEGPERRKKYLFETEMKLYASCLGPHFRAGHLPALFELLFTGRPLLVLAASASYASEVVMGLMSLLQPIDIPLDCVRPYVTMSSTQAFPLTGRRRVNRTESDEEEEGEGEDVGNDDDNGEGVILIGASNPFFLRSERFENVLICCPNAPNDRLSSQRRRNQSETQDPSEGGRRRRRKRRNHFTHYVPDASRGSKLVVGQSKKSAVRNRLMWQKNLLQPGGGGVFVTAKSNRFVIAQRAFPHIDRRAESSFLHSLHRDRESARRASSSSAGSSREAVHPGVFQDDLLAPRPRRYSGDGSCSSPTNRARSASAAPTLASSSSSTSSNTPSLSVSSVVSSLDSFFSHRIRKRCRAVVRELLRPVDEAFDDLVSSLSTSTPSLQTRIFLRSEVSSRLLSETSRERLCRILSNRKKFPRRVFRRLARDSEILRFYQRFIYSPLFPPWLRMKIDDEYYSCSANLDVEAIAAAFADQPVGLMDLFMRICEDMKIQERSGAVSSRFLKKLHGVLMDIIRLAPAECRQPMLKHIT